MMLSRWPILWTRLHLLPLWPKLDPINTQTGALEACIATPTGPTCHSGTSSCFGDRIAPGTGFIAELERILAKRATADPATSYTARLMSEGIKRIAQKVGEEGVESALAGVAGDDSEVVSEAADLVYHLTLLLHVRGLSWSPVIDELRRRHAASSATASS